MVRGDSEDEEREFATRAFTAVSRSATSGTALEVEDELFDAVADNDAVRLEALLKVRRACWGPG